MSEPKEKPKIKNRTIDEMFKKIRENESPESQNETPLDYQTNPGK